MKRIKSYKQMKKLILLSLLSLSIVGCKSTSHSDCGTQSNGVTKPVYTRSMSEKLQSEDAKFIKENWTKEQIDQFAREYIYKTIVINGDTLK
jgi:uncharacterized protein YcfL